MNSLKRGQNLPTKERAPALGRRSGRGMGPPELTSDNPVPVRGTPRRCARFHPPATFMTTTRQRPVRNIPATTGTGQFPGGGNRSERWPTILRPSWPAHVGMVQLLRPGIRACLKTLPCRGVRARGLRVVADNTSACRPGAPTGRVFKPALNHSLTLNPPLNLKLDRSRGLEREIKRETSSKSEITIKSQLNSSPRNSTSVPSL